MSKTKIRIDYSRCGEKGEIDPRDCTKCLKVCDPCVFLMHETIGAKEGNIYDPQNWRITPVWPSVCMRCLICVEICPVKAISIKW
ncbi:MAG: 4Fe-4S binding protein [Candidatus Thorarchaeota archaeon]